MNDTITRPTTLHEVQRRADAGQDFDPCLREFLDEFYLDRDSSSRAARLTREPVLVEDAVRNAFLAAVAEHLCSRWRLGPSPAWVEAPERFLSSPIFFGGERLKPFVLAESPSAFRRRFIFTEAEPLRRARTPRDLKWWEHETQRNGSIPSKDDLMEAIALSEVPEDRLHDILTAIRSGCCPNNIRTIERIGAC